MVLFKDINRSSTDLLTKDYPNEKPWDVDFLLQSKNPKCNATASLTPSGGVETAANLTYVSQLLTYEAKFNAGGASSLDIKYPVTNALTFGSKVERSSGKGKGFGDKSEISVEFKDDKLHSRAHVNPFNGSFNVSTVITKELPTLTNEKKRSAFLGGEIGGSSSALNYSLGLGYSFHSFNRRILMTAKTAPHGDYTMGKVVGNVHAQSTDSKNEFSLEVMSNFVDNKSSVSLGGKWCLKQSYGSSIRARVAHDGKVAAAFSLPLDEAKMSTATFGLQVDSGKLATARADAFTYGLKLNLRGATTKGE